MTNGEPAPKKVPKRRVPGVRGFAVGAVASVVAVFSVLAFRVHAGDDPALASTKVSNNTATTTTTTSSTSDDPYDYGDDSGSTSSDDSSSTQSNDSGSTPSSSSTSSGSVSSTPQASTSAS